MTSSPTCDAKLLRDPSQLACSLPFELAEPILAITVHLAAIGSRWNPWAIAQPLHALPRSVSPVLTKLALMHMPNVDLDTATHVNNVDMLRLIVAWSKEPGGRPVHFKRPIAVAAREASVAALDWWMDESGLCFDWNADGGLVLPACDRGNLDVLEWWRLRGFPHLDSPYKCDIETMVDAISSATRGGHAHILDWLLEHFPSAQDVFDAAVESQMLLVHAAQSGQTVMLDWWTQKARQGVFQMPTLAPIPGAALQHRNVDVLEWCIRNPQVVQQYHEQCPVQPRSSLGQSDSGSVDVQVTTWANHAGNTSFPEEHWQASTPVGDAGETRGESRPNRTYAALPRAVQGQLTKWIDRLGITPFKEEYWPACQAACVAGDIEALAWLHKKGYLVGSRLQLVSVAVDAETPYGDTLATLDWIFTHVDLAVPDASDADPTTPYKRFDPYFGACKRGWVHVLDWLHSHGYQLHEADFAYYFHLACQNSSRHPAVLDWLLARTTLTSIALRAIAFSHGLASASCNSSIPALDWWQDKFRSGVIAPLTDTDAVLDLPLGLFHLDVCAWWLKYSGVLREYVEWQSPCLEMCKSTAPKRTTGEGVKVLQLWLDAGQPIDFPLCINMASVHGNLEVLDWLLHEAKAPADDFVAAFTSKEYGHVDQVGGDELAAYPAKSLLWFWANVPQVCGKPALDINRGPMSNPIHHHIATTMLKLSHVPIQDLDVLSENGNVAMLMYVKGEGYLTSMLEAVLDEGALDFILMTTSEGSNDQVHVLEWWESQSGCDNFDIPESVRYNDILTGWRTDKWWSKWFNEPSRVAERMKILNQASDGQ